MLLKHWLLSTSCVHDSFSSESTDTTIFPKETLLLLPTCVVFVPSQSFQVVHFHLWINITQFSAEAQLKLQNERAPRSCFRFQQSEGDVYNSTSHIGKKKTVHMACLLFNFHVSIPCCISRSLTFNYWS